MSKTLVVMIHGIGVKSKEWWGCTIDKLNSDKDLIEKNFTFIPYAYETRKIDGVINKCKNFVGLGDTVAELKYIGNNLISTIHSDHDTSDYDNIMMFGHSMGGFVIANALIYANDTKTVSYIAKKISHVTFCGTPLGGADLADRAKKIFPDWYINPHLRTLTKESCVREIMAHRIKNFVEFGGTKKTNLSFIIIGNDQVVTTDEERFGIYNNQLKDIHTPVITGTHSQAVQNLSPDNENSNFNIIKKHFLSCYNSDISRQNRVGKDERNELKIRWEHAFKLLESTKVSYFDVLTREIIENQIRKISHADKAMLKMINTFIDLNIFYRKTFLQNKKVILDINRTMIIVDGSRNTSIEIYTGFSKASEFAKKEFIEDKLIKVFKEKCCSKTERFQEYSMNVKKIDRSLDEHQLIPISIDDIEFEYDNSRKDSTGFKTIIDLGVYNENDEVDVLISFTLPTTLWEKNVSNEDIITLPSNALNSEIIVQEELYGNTTYSLTAKVLPGNDINSNIIRNKSSSIYYKTYTAKKTYNKIDNINHPLTIAISKI